MGKNQDPGSGINIPDPQHWKQVTGTNVFRQARYPCKKVYFCQLRPVRIANADQDLGEANQSADPEHWLKRTNVLRQARYQNQCRKEHFCHLRPDPYCNCGFRSGRGKAIRRSGTLAETGTNTNCTTTNTEQIDGFPLFASSEADKNCNITHRNLPNISKRPDTPTPLFLCKVLYK